MLFRSGVEASAMAIKKRLIELQERIAVRESEAVENGKYITGYNSTGIPITISWVRRTQNIQRVILYMMITARRYIPQWGSRQAQAFRLAYR